MIRGGIIGASRRRTAGVSLLLDTYPAAVAYSLRKLRTAYSGSAIRVRRASDNTEQDIGFSGNNLDTSALSTFCAGTDGFVKTWYDQSGNGYDLSQTTAGTQPRIVSGGTVDTKNTKPAIYFNNKRMERSPLPFMSHSNDFSYFSATSHETSGGAGTIFCTTSNDEIRMCGFHTRGNAPGVNIYVQIAGGTGYPAGLSTTRNNSDLRIQSGFLTSAKAMSAFDNGAAGTTNTYTGTYNNNQLRIGMQFLDLTFLVGHFSELIFYSSHETANRVAIETDMNNYYGVF